MLKYLVSYFHETGVGRIFIEAKSPIDTEDRIVETEEVIAKKGNLKRVGITNFILLKE